MCNRRTISLNCFSIAFFFVVVPAICIVRAFLPLAAFASLVCTMCLHNRAPYSHRVARCFARMVSSGWGPQRMQVEGVTENTGRTRCFLVAPSHRFGLSPGAGFHEKLLVWANLLLSEDEWTKPLIAVTELPAICNAPVVRLLFQLAGFVDFRAASVTSAIDRGHDLLLFDEVLAEMQAAKQTPSLDVRHVTIKVDFGR